MGYKVGCPAHLKQLLHNKLNESALTDKDGKQMQLKLCTAQEAKSLNIPFAVEGFQIPYFDIEGRPTGFYRYRYLADTRRGFDAVTGKKPVRYVQPSNSDPEIYFPPLLDWVNIVGEAETIPLLVTEGELKAACATSHGFPTIGLGGVWSFQSNKHSQALLPAFDLINFKERAVYIVFDSDAVTNPNVVAAEVRFARRLTERGARVFICRLPQHQEVKKVGLDDYIMLYSVEQLKTDVLDKAFPFQESVVLHELNSKVVYIRDPGLIWDYDLNMRMSPSAFKDHAYANVHYLKQTVSKRGEPSLVRTSAAKAWIEWESRNECRGLVYSPGKQRITEDGMLNTWKGWGISAPIEGDTTQWERLMQHLFAEDIAARKWFEQWCAYPLQNPGVKMATAAAIWGPVHGSGKTLVGHTLMRIYGANAVELKDKDLESARFEWAENKQFALADDMSSKGDRKYMRQLMTMVTQKHIHLDPKYVPSYFVEDRINYYFTSNEPDALFMDDADRRFFVHETRADKLPDHKAYVDWRDSDEGIAALWYYLLHVDVSDFDPQAKAPFTKGKQSMIELGKSELGAWVLELRTNTDQVLRRANMSGDLFTASELHMIFDPADQKRASPNALARELKRTGIHPPANGSKIRLADGSMRMVYAVRNTDVWARRTWKEACDHYNNHRQIKPKSKKF